MLPAKTWRNTWRRRNVSEPVLIKSTTAVTRYYRWHTFGIMSWWHIIFQNHDTTVYCTPENSNTINTSLLWSNQVTKLCFHCSKQKEKNRPTVCDVWSLMMANNTEIKSPSHSPESHRDNFACWTHDVWQFTIFSCLTHNFWQSTLFHFENTIFATI